MQPGGRSLGVACVTAIWQPGLLLTSEERAAGQRGEKERRDVGRSRLLGSGAGALGNRDLITGQNIHVRPL